MNDTRDTTRTLVEYAEYRERDKTPSRATGCNQEHPKKRHRQDWETLDATTAPTCLIDASFVPSRKGTADTKDKKQHAK